MSFLSKALADGFVATSVGAIFTATADTATYVKSITLGNTNAAEQTVKLYINNSGTNRFWRQFTLAQYESADVLDGAQSIILSDGDSIQAETTTSSAVAYTVSGVEETP